MTTTSDRDGRTPADPAIPGASSEFPYPADEQPTVVLTAYGELPAYSSANVLPVSPVGRHREPRSGPPRRPTPTPLGRVVLPAALALVSGVALAAAWGHLQEARSVQEPTAAVSHRATAPSPAPSGAALVAAAPSAVAASSPPPAATVHAVVDRSVPVVVLNATSRTGLAAKVAAMLRKDGWTVVSIGNYRGRGITATTVFAAGHAQAVTTIRGDLPTRDAVATPTGSMSRARITVVVGADYPRH